MLMLRSEGPKDVNESFVQLAVAPMPLQHLQETSMLAKEVELLP